MCGDPEVEGNMCGDPEVEGNIGYDYIYWFNSELRTLTEN